MEFKFLGETYIEIKDEECNCLNDKCEFINRDCETLQEYGEIPYCLSNYRQDGFDVAFVKKYGGI